MKPRSFLVLLAIAAAMPCAASENAPALTLEDSVRLALANHPSLRAAQAATEAAKAAIGEASASLYPQLDASAGYHRFQKRAFLPSGLVLPGREAPKLIGPLSDWTGGVASRMTVYDFGERRAGVAAAEARHAGAVYEAEYARAELRLAVKQAYYALAAAKELLAAAEKNLARAEAHLKLAQARRRVGAVPLADELRMEAEHAGARLQLSAARSRVLICAGALNTAMGRPTEMPVTLAALSLAPPPTGGDLGVYFQKALANRPELHAASKRAEAARSSLEASRASRAPKLRADASFGWNDTAWLPQTEEWQAGFSVEIPIFDAGARGSRVARSKAELSREEAAAEQKKLQIRQEVWLAHTERDRTWTAIGLNEAMVRSSSESLRVVRERYERGAAVVTDLLDTQTALARAEASLAEARWSYLAACAALERAVGEGEVPAL